TLQSDTTNLNNTVLRLLDLFGADIKFLRDPTRGGVASALNEIARDTHLGVEIQQEAIKVREEVAGACEMLGLDPLFVANEGVFLMIVAAGRATQILEELRRLPNGADAAIIGEIVEEHPRQVVLHSRVGGRRVVSMPAGEQLPRIC
ncbi:MAG: HypE family hydrogenase expression/formation protein, partial [Saprospiraceae bacterium]